MNNIETLLATYQPSEATKQRVRAAPPLLVAGISGAGKGTIRGELLKRDEFIDFVSYTTRAPRKNNGVMERDGVEYHFISLDEAQRMLEQGEFIEAKLYSGNVYGTTTNDIERAHQAGKIALNDIEVQGISEYLQIAPDIKVAYIVPPRFQVWMDRLTQRYNGAIDQADLQRRLQTAQRELAWALAEPRMYFVMNDDLSTAVADVAAVAQGNAQRSEHNREVARQIARDLEQYLALS